MGKEKLEEELREFEPNHPLPQAIKAFFDGLKGMLPGLKDIFQLALPLAMLYMQWITKTQLNETKAELAETKAQVVQKAEEAVDEAKQVKRDLAESTEDRKEEMYTLKELQKAGLLQWRAFNSKSPEDVIEAKVAEVRALEVPPAKPDEIP